MRDKVKTIIITVIVTIIVLFAALFVLIMLLPDDEYEAEQYESSDAISSEETADEGPTGEDLPDEKSEDTDAVEADEEPYEGPKVISGYNGIDPVYLGTDADSATIMIYMNGSDLETEAGEATRDISEMLDSGIGENVNVIIQTMGTKKWQNYGISSKTSQIYKLKSGELQLIEDDLGQLDCTSADTLSDFITYSKKNYPADRYVLLFWDHGGGPVYGFGYDEWQDEEAALTLDEIQSALSDNKDINFDIIGMDCCIMASLETCYVLAPFCKYSVLSEDFESELGWSYEGWMKSFEENPGISAPLLGKKIIEEMISANEDDEEYGGSATMVLVNERAIPDLVSKWIKYAYDNSDQLLGSNYSRLHKARGKGLLEILWYLWSYDDSYVTMDDYYVSDMMSIVESIGSEGGSTDDLRTALKDSVAYFGHTSDTNELTGLSVSLPYGDKTFYDELAEIYTKCGIDANYITWLENFVDASGITPYDYSEFEDSWSGWSTYEEGWDSPDRDEELDDWEYDYEEEIWYLYEDGITYLYDEDSDMMYCYDEDEDETYYYDEDDDEWYVMSE